MKIAYFPNQIALNAQPVLDAFLRSCTHLGIETLPNRMDADAAVIWSVLWNGRMAGNEQVYNYYRATNRPVIILETGSLRRGITWKIAVNNITANGYYGHDDNLDLDRPVKLNINITKELNPLPHILVTAQHNRSLQVNELTSIEDWLRQQILLIKNHTDRPIHVRPHPRCRLDHRNFSKELIFEKTNRIPGTYDSFDLNLNCHAVINYNSGVGIQSALCGTRTIVHSSSLASPVGITIENIEKPYDVDRDRWLVKICHTEYTLDEIINGLWYQRLQSAL